MSWLTWREKVLAGSILVGLMGAALVASAPAQQKATPPDFSSNLAGWVGFNGGGPFFEPAPGRLPAPIVSDPKYLAQVFITSTHFRKEPDNSKWMPSPCEAVRGKK